MILLDELPTYGWMPKNTATGDPRVPAPVPEEPNPLRWRDCPTCWAQGRVYAMDLGRYAYCWTCGGIGQVMGS